MPLFDREYIRPSLAEVDCWQAVAARPDPIAPCWDRFWQQAATTTIPPTGLTRDDYLNVIAGNVDYFRQFQDTQGAIIDPYTNVEVQYATPCYALAAAALVVHASRDDLLESAARATDWAILTLSQRRAANAHEDFFPPPIAHALLLLKSRVDPERYAQWEKQIRGFDPFDIYRVEPGGNNWNVVALSGEGLFYQLGLRDDKQYIEYSLAAQGRHFASPWGLYTEGPMAYDHFPRIWVADLLSTGFHARRTDELAELLRRGALTSMFMQSPAGELPVGGRSAHHQWNEAEQCVTYEIYAAHALKNGDADMAGIFKRAAHLALSSIRNWVRPTGELWIVKNRNDPAQRHGYESYSSHSQYNLLTVAMLANAYEHAGDTESLAEKPAPADVGGFVIHLPEPFTKLIANAGGTYIVIDHDADLAHNPTGLLRVHFAGADPQLGPSDGLTGKAAYQLPDGPRTTAAVGVSWRDNTGNWLRLAEFGRFHGKHDHDTRLDVSLQVFEQSPQHVVFSLTYSGNFNGPQQIIEHYTLTPGQLEQRTELVNYQGPTRLIWPILVNDGANEHGVRLSDRRLTVTSPRGSQTFVAMDAEHVRLLDDRYACRNGWARIAVADYDEDAQPTLRIRPTDH